MSKKFPEQAVLPFPAKFISTNAVHYVDCPKCGAEAGFYCVTPSDKKKRGGLCAHIERMVALPDEIFNLSKLTVRSGKLLYEEEL